MQRTVPSSVSDEIELYVRTYYSLLRSSGEIAIRSLEETHAGMRSSLHLGAAAAELDVGALLYTSARLPPCAPDLELLVLGQTPEQFERAGYLDIDTWQAVRAPGRRRRMLWDRKATLAALIASVSDIDDLIPIVTAYQIEWNKVHALLQGSPVAGDLQSAKHLDEPILTKLAMTLNLSLGETRKLCTGLQPAPLRTLRRMAERPMALRLRLLAGSFIDYQRAADRWFEPVGERLKELAPSLPRPAVYMVSSNTHSLANLLGGYALAHQDELGEFVRKENPEALAVEAARLAERRVQEPGPEAETTYANLLYYLLRHHIRSPGDARSRLQAWDTEHGIHAVANPHHVEVDAQLIDIGKLKAEHLDPRVRVAGADKLARSQAFILNIDYPLGMAAYHLLARVALGRLELRGLWLMGKAATLNGRVGDVMISQVVHDEHSRNTYLFKNSLAAGDIAPYLKWGSVFDNQKALTVRSTILQNREFMNVFYDEGYTVLEMETGPYLSALYEIANPRRHPRDEIVTLFQNMPFDVGIVHYASDTPYSRRQTLLSKSLSYFGVDATYAAATAILRQILDREVARLG
jgi:hypothetical protein